MLICDLFPIALATNTSVKNLTHDLIASGAQLLACGINHVGGTKCYQIHNND